MARRLDPPVYADEACRRLPSALPIGLKELPHGFESLFLTEGHRAESSCAVNAVVNTVSERVGTHRAAADLGLSHPCCQRNLSEGPAENS